MRSGRSCVGGEGLAEGESEEEEGGRGNGKDVKCITIIIS